MLESRFEKIHKGSKLSHREKQIFDAVAELDNVLNKHLTILKNDDSIDGDKFIGFILSVTMTFTQRSLGDLLVHGIPIGCHAAFIDELSQNLNVTLKRIHKELIKQSLEN